MAEHSMFDPKAALDGCGRVDRAYTQSNVIVGNSKALVEIVDGVNRVSLPGTNCEQDWIQDVEFFKTFCTWLKGNVHGGFLGHLEPMMIPILKRLDKSLPVESDGHSLGGPVSQMLAIYLAQNGFKVQMVRTFGCPPNWFDDSLIEWNKWSIPTENWVNSGDVVPNCLFRNPAYGIQHAGSSIYFDATGIKPKQDAFPMDWIWKWEADERSMHSTDSTVKGSYALNLEALVANG